MNWIKYVIFSVCMMVLYGWMQSLGKRAESNISTDATNYIVDLPKVLRQVFSIIFIIGMFMSIVFAFFYYKKLGEATVGHIYFALTFALIGLVVIVACSRWKIEVNGDKMTLYNVFGPKKTINIKDIDEVEVGIKWELKLYVSGKKIKTVDRMTNNYTNLYNTLVKYKVLIEPQETD